MSLRVLIVEDEPMAQANLSRTLQKYYPVLFSDKDRRFP